MTLDASTLAALEHQDYISLVTFRRTGESVQTPVWFAERAGKVYVFTAAGSWKVRRLRNNPRIRVAPCNVRGRIRGAWMEGHARRIEDHVIERGAYEALLAKYGWQMRLLNFFSCLGGRIGDRTILELEF